MNFTSLGGRKHLLTWAVFLVSTVLVWFAKIPPDTWAAVLSWSVGAYLAANVTQRHIDTRNSNVADPAPPAR